MNYLHRFVHLGVRFEDFPNGGFMVHHNTLSSLAVEMKCMNHLDLSLIELKESTLGKLKE